MCFAFQRIIMLKVTEWDALISELLFLGSYHL